VAERDPISTNRGGARASPYIAERINA